MEHIYLSDGALHIRRMRPEDAQVIYDTYLSYDWHPVLDTYLRYYQEQEQDQRLVFIAEYEGQVGGLCTLVWHPTEGPWAHQGYPEIVDLSVFYHLHRRGIGNHLMEVAEREAARRADMVYLAVGLHAGYGAAQHLYAKRGYLPDGSGVWYRGQALPPYAPCCNDDDLWLFLSKKLRNP